MSDTYRDAQDEIATLRADLATWEAACASAMAEVEALKADVRRLDQRWQGLVDELNIHDEWEPFIQPPERRVAAYVKEAIRDAEAQRAKQRHLLAEREREHNAAQHAVDVYRQGNLMGTVVAVARLGEVLDGGT